MVLDLLGVGVLAGLDQRHYEAGLAGAGRATRAVQIRLVVFGRVEVDNAGHAVHVDPPSGDIGGDQGFDPAVDELLERSGAAVLGVAAVNCGRADPALGELAGQSV